MNTRFSVAVAVSFLLTLSSLAQADPSEKDVSPAGFWDGLITLASQCAVVPYTVVHGTKVLGMARSQCSDLILKANELDFTLFGQSFAAQVQDSADSDGGDLNDLVVTDSQGNVIIQKSEILAYGDVIQALVGAKVQLKEVYDATLSSR
jgi:hypothetical protein